MMSLDALEGCAKNPIKIAFFYTPACQMQKKQKKEEEKKKRQKEVTPIFGGALKTGSSSTIFSKKSGFFFPNSSKSLNPIFIAFPEKMGGNHFFEKGYVTRRTALEGKNDNFLVSFRHKCLRRCQTKKRGEVGGRSPPQKGREKHSHGIVLVVFVVVGCCFCFFFLLLLLLLYV